MADSTAGSESESTPAADPATAAAATPGAAAFPVPDTAPTLAAAPAPAPAEKVAARPKLSRRRRVGLVLLSLFTALALGVAAIEAIKTVQTWPDPIEPAIDPLIWEPGHAGGLAGPFDWLPAVPPQAGEADGEAARTDDRAAPGSRPILPRSEAMEQNPLNLRPPPGSVGRYGFRRITPPWIEEVVSWSNAEQSMEQAVAYLAAQLAEAGFVEAGRQQLSGGNLALRFVPAGLQNSGRQDATASLTEKLDRSLVQLHFAQQDGRIRIMILFRYVMR